MIDVRKALGPVCKFVYVCPDCMHTAFYLIDEVYEGTAVTAANAILLNGSHPLSGDNIRCGNCHMYLHHLSTTNIRSYADRPVK